MEILFFIAFNGLMGNNEIYRSTAFKYTEFTELKYGNANVVFHETGPSIKDSTRERPGKPTSHTHRSAYNERLIKNWSLGFTCKIKTMLSQIT